MNIPNTVLQKEHVTLAFGTPLSTYLWPNSEALNAALAYLILQKEKAERGVTSSNCVRTLKDRMTTSTQDTTWLVATGGSPRKSVGGMCSSCVSK
jgi:hypothetical protein